MSLWDGCENAKPTGQGHYLGEGKFRLRVERLFIHDARGAGPAFIAEFTVVTSTNAEHTPGSKASFYQSFNPPKPATRDMAIGTIKGFFYALLGLETKAEQDAFDAKSKAVMAAATEGEANPCMGYEVNVETWSKKTQKDTDFTVHDWSPARDEAGAAIKRDYEALARGGVRSSSNGGPPPLPGSGGGGFQLPPGGQFNPDKTLYWAPGMADWATVPKAPAGPPPLPNQGPPPLPKPAWTLPAGGQLSSDKTLYWAPGMADWAKVPA